MNKSKFEHTLAILWSVGGIIFFFLAAGGVFKGTESMQTQIVQGIFGICMLICGFYWGNSVSKKNPIKSDDEDTPPTE